jgi:4a-hydroxytetrahydrobiopterin dehydratase
MERKKLTAEEIENALRFLSGWRAEDDKLKKRFSFENFAAALDFVNKAGAIAERHDHHPDIFFGWGYAEFFITTHDRGGITGFDVALAKEIDELKTEIRA